MIENFVLLLGDADITILLLLLLLLLDTDGSKELMRWRRDVFLVVVVLRERYRAPAPVVVR